MDGGGEGNISLLIGVFKFVVDFLERDGPGRTCAGTDGAAPVSYTHLGKIMNGKTKALKERIRELASSDVCLAFSGGVDSGLLMKLFVEAGAKLHPVMFDTRLHPRADIEGARRLAAECGLTLSLIHI